MLTLMCPHHMSEKQLESSFLADLVCFLAKSDSTRDPGSQGIW